MAWNVLEEELQQVTRQLEFLEKCTPHNQEIITILKERRAELKRELGIDPPIEHKIKETKAEYKPKKIVRRG